MISVIIPTYKAPEALDICLKSAIENQVNSNEIIVVAYVALPIHSTYSHLSNVLYEAYPTVCDS